MKNKLDRKDLILGTLHGKWTNHLEQDFSVTDNVCTFSNGAVHRMVVFKKTCIQENEDHFLLDGYKLMKKCVNKDMMGPNKKKVILFKKISTVYCNGSAIVGKTDLDYGVVLMPPKSAGKRIQGTKRPMSNSSILEKDYNGYIFGC